MKVNLSYSVELGDVLPSVEKLYLENKNRFETNYNISTALSKVEFKDAKLESTMRNIAHAHDTVLEFATKLEEITNILRGYHQVVMESVQAPLPDPDLQMPLPLDDEEPLSEPVPSTEEWDE